MAFVVGHTGKGETRMTGNIQENITRGSIWLRLVYMVVLGVAFYVAEFVTWVVVVIQFLTSLFTGRTNDRLTRLGRNLAQYLKQIMVFLTFAGEEKPFPFAPWPDEPDGETAMKESGSQTEGVSEMAASEGAKDEIAKPKSRTARKPPSSRKTPAGRKSKS